MSRLYFSALIWYFKDVAEHTFIDLLHIDFSVIILQDHYVEHTIVTTNMDLVAKITLFLVNICKTAAYKFLIIHAALVGFRHYKNQEFERTL